MYRQYRRRLGEAKRLVIGGLLRKGAVMLFGHVPRKIQKKLDQYGNDIPVSIQIARAPIQSIIKSVLNLLSNNALQKWMSNKSYDDVYHLSMIFKTNDGKTHRLEKNQVITWDDYKPREDEELIDLGMSPENKTLKEIFYLTQDRIGRENMWLYSAFRYNCQDFIKQILITMSLWDGETESFVYQDVGVLLEMVNPLTKGIAQEATDYAGAFSSLADHFGFKRGGVVVNQRLLRNSL